MAEISVLLPVPPGVDAGPTVADLLGQRAREVEILVLAREAPTLEAADRVRFVPVDEGPLGTALNAGLAEATGTFVARATPGDRSAKERLAHQAMLLRSSAKLAFVATGWRAVSADGTVARTVRPPAGDAALRAAMAEGDAIGHPTALMRREAVRKMGGWRPAFVGLEDYDLLLRLLSRHAGSCTPEPLVASVADPPAPDWRASEQHILSELAAATAHDRRQAGRADVGDGSAPADRTLLHRMGMADDEITRILTERALTMALAAGAAGEWRAMREAARLGLQQSAAPAPMRSRLRGLWLRSLVHRAPDAETA